MPHDPLAPHSHDPNPEPPSADATIVVTLPDGRSHTVTPASLGLFTAVTLTDCYIISTGHGTSGPFTFEGPTLGEVVRHFAGEGWSQVEVIAGDGFGTRVSAFELAHPVPAGPIILALRRDGRPLRRDDGLVRLIVPAEDDDALRQVKWVARIRVVGAI